MECILMLTQTRVREEKMSTNWKVVKEDLE